MEDGVVRVFASKTGMLGVLTIGHVMIIYLLSNFQYMFVEDQ
jgi:hypothetical protein